jgi:hypothetical protein
MRGLGFAVALACLAGCGKSEDSGGTSGSTSGGGGSPATAALYEQNNSPENLSGLLDTIMKSAEGGDSKKAATLLRGLFPDRAALQKAVRDDAPAGFVDECLKQNESIPTGDAELAALFKRGGPDRTEVKAYGATTEEIREYKDGSVPFKEFPGGTRKLAEQVLRPGMTFYEVEFTAPGEDSGMKFHMFYWDGSAWRMLGPAWRALR